MNTKDDWENIKFFIALAKEGSLIGAANLINSNHTTVYRRIKKFEEQYHINLFERTPTGYFLTPQGEELFKYSEEIEQKMDNVFQNIQGLENQLKGEVCITTTQSLARIYLPELMVKIRDSWPLLNLDFRVSNNFYNLSRREADIAIRPSNIVPDHLVGRKLGKINFGIFGSKKLFSRKINFNKEQEKLKFLGLSDSLSHLLSSQWLEKNIPKKQVIAHVDELTTMAQLCEAGVGVALLPLYFEAQFKELKLIYDLEDFIGNDLWILTHKNQSQLPKIKVCTEFLYQELKIKLAKYFI